MNRDFELSLPYMDVRPRTAPQPSRDVAPGAEEPRVPGRRRLWDAASGRFDPVRLRSSVVARGWSVPEFAAASEVSRSCLYKALGGYAVGDRTVVRILRTLDSRAPTGLLDE